MLSASNLAQEGPQAAPNQETEHPPRLSYFFLLYFKDQLIDQLYCIGHKYTQKLRAITPGQLPGSSSGTSLPHHTARVSQNPSYLPR